MKSKPVNAVPREYTAAAALFLMLSVAACDEKAAVDNGVSAPVVQQPVKVPEISDDMRKAEQQKAADKANAALAAKVKSAVMAEPSLKELTIDVTADGGEVKLFGTAGTRALRDKAEQVASKVESVKSVANNLEIVAGS